MGRGGGDGGGGKNRCPRPSDALKLEGRGGTKNVVKHKKSFVERCPQQKRTSIGVRSTSVVSYDQRAPCGATDRAFAYMIQQYSKQCEANQLRATPSLLTPLCSSAKLKLTSRYTCYPLCLYRKTPPAKVRFLGCWQRGSLSLCFGIIAPRA